MFTDSFWSAVDALFVPDEPACTCTDVYICQVCIDKHEALQDEMHAQHIAQSL